MTTAIQELRDRLQGPVNSIPTTFTREGEIDWEGLRGIVDVGIEGGSNVALLTYGDSQFAFLSDEEVGELTKAVVEHVNGRAVVVAATRRWWTRKAVDFAAYCKELGADLLMMLPSEEFAHDPSSKAAWYKAAAREIPVMLVGDLKSFLLDAVCDEPRICSFKEDGGLESSLDQMVRYAGQWEFVTGGTLQRHLVQWPLGCRSFLSWPSSFAPLVAQRYWDAVQHGDLKAGFEIVRTVEMPFIQFCVERFPEGMQDVWRAAMEINGIAQRYLRPPRRSIQDAEMELVRDEMQRLGLLNP